MKTAKNKGKNIRGISPVITTLIISGTLLIILVIASFVSTNLLELQMANTEFEQAKTNMMLLDEVIQDVALRPGAGGYVQFNQRSGGIGIANNTQQTIKITAVPTVINSPSTTPSGNWKNPYDAYSLDNSPAYTSSDGSTQQYGNYGFNIPSNAIVTRVEVGYKAWTDTQGDDQISLTCSWNGGTNWAAWQNSGKLNNSVAFANVTWINFTSATSWDYSKLSNANFRVMVKGIKIGNRMDNVYLDWIPVRVEYYFPESDIYELPSSINLVYRGGSKVSGADMRLRGYNVPYVPFNLTKINVTDSQTNMTDSLSYLRVETGSGVQIKLDYNRVRIINSGLIFVGSKRANFTEITFIRLLQGNTTGSGTVNVKAQNININTTTVEYNTNHVTLRIQIGNNQPEFVSLFSENPDAVTVIMITEVVIRISIS